MKKFFKIVLALVLIVFYAAVMTSCGGPPAVVLETKTFKLVVKEDSFWYAAGDSLFSYTFRDRHGIKKEWSTNSRYNVGDRILQPVY